MISTAEIHLTVGTADTFYLDSALRLEATMKGLEQRLPLFVEGRGHLDLYTAGDDRWGLYQAIAWEITGSPGRDRSRSSAPPPPTASAR